MKISLSLHVIGLVMWLGGLLILSRLTFLTVKNDSSSPSLTHIKKLSNAWIILGATLTVGTGITQMLLGGVARYMAQGWFHGKLTLVLVLIVVSVLFNLDLKKLSLKQEIRPVRFMIWHGITGMILFLGVFLTILFRY